MLLHFSPACAQPPRGSRNTTRSGVSSTSRAGRSTRRRCRGSRSRCSAKWAPERCALHIPRRSNSRQTMCIIFSCSRRLFNLFPIGEHVGRVDASARAASGLLRALPRAAAASARPAPLHVRLPHHCHRSLSGLMLLVLVLVMKAF